MQISSTISYIQTCRQQNCQFFALTVNGCECSAQKGRGSGLQHQSYLFQIVFELNQPGVRNDRLVVNLTPVAAAGAVAAAKLCLVLLLTPALPYQRRPGPPTSNLSRLRRLIRWIYWASYLRAVQHWIQSPLLNNHGNLAYHRRLYQYRWIRRCHEVGPCMNNLDRKTGLFDPPPPLLAAC